jgi:hypothetical protein
MLDASKRGQIRKRSAYSKADLLAITRRLYNALELQFRVLGQRNGCCGIFRVAKPTGPAVQGS